MEFGLNILIDICVLFLLIFGYFQAKKCSFFSELFSLMGIGLAACISLHYYVRLSELMSKRFLIPELSCQISVYVFLVIFLGFLLSIGFESLAAVFKLEVHPMIDKWGGFLVGLFKIYFMIGLLFLGLYVSQQKIIVKAASQSLSQYLFKDLSTGFYSFCFDKIIVKIIPSAKKNTKVFEVVSGLSKKSL